MRLKPLALLAATVLASSCSLLTRFDDGTQPCDERAAPADQCVTGFHCVNGLCVDGGFAASDAGSPGDGGARDAGP
jgi:hypothetical protein